MAQKLGQVAEGKLVKIKENGSLVEFYVAKHDYESGLNGPGRTLLVRKDCYDKRKWGFDSGNNDYSFGAIDDWFNTEYKNILPVDIQTAMGTTKFYYTPGNGNLVVTTIERSIFALSMKELGLSDAYANVEGSTLPIARTLKIANFNGGPNTQWTRSTYTKNNYYAWFVDSHGSSAYGSTSNATQGSRPCFTLPSDLYVWSNGTLSRLPVPPPSPVTTPSSIMQSQPINVTWSVVEEADSYVLQRKADGGEWEQVYAGADTSYTDTAGSWTTVQYQVCGVFGGVNGAFAVSPTIQVLPASALSIGGTDGDLGALTSDVPYSVATNTGKNVTMDIAVNGVNVFHRADATTYTGTLSVLDLPTGMGSIVLSASVQADSGMVTTERKWTYTKPAQPFPASGGVAALTKDGKPLFPQTLAECVRTIGGPWGGDLSKALEKLARAATFIRDRQAKYTEVKVDLGKVKAGDIVNLPVKGIMTPHIVVQVGNPDPAMYDASCDGVWLLRKNIVENGQWNSTNVNTLSGSTIMTTMQGYVDDYDSTVQAAIKTVKIPYCVGGGDTTVKTLADGLECKMFPLGVYELGWTQSNESAMPQDGVTLSYFNGLGPADAKRAATFNGGRTSYWLRSPRTNNSISAWGCDTSGSFVNNTTNYASYGFRYCFLLPTTFQATYLVDTSGTVHASQEYTNGGDFYDLWGNVIPTVKIATGSYVGTGTYGSMNPNTLTFPFEPKVVFIQYSTVNSTYDNIYRATIICSESLFETVHHEINNAGTSSGTRGGTCNLTTHGNTISWYVHWAVSGTGDSGAQLNSVNSIYNYVAIG